jgi:hypothetical protein
MDREVIKLNNSQWCDLAFEDYLEIDGVEIPIEIKSRQHEGGGRHTESYSLVFKRLSDNKYFRIGYETSVKDSMGWTECNYGSTEATEVFPKVIEIIIYE